MVQSIFLDPMPIGFLLAQVYKTHISNMLKTFSGKKCLKVVKAIYFYVTIIAEV
jgi:hypothetical protein